MQGFSDLQLKWDAGLLRPCVRCGVPQTRVGWDAELLRFALNVGLLRPASEVSVLLWMRGLLFSLKHDLHIEVRFASDDLSLVIFWIAYRTPSKVFDTLQLTGTDFETLWTSVGFELPMIGLAIFRDALSLILSGLWSSWVYCWTAWSL